MDDIEACTSGSLTKNDSALRHFSPEHMLFNIIEFFFRQIVEDKVIFERVQDKSFVSLGLWLSHRLDSLISHSQSDFIETVNLILFLELLNHVVIVKILGKNINQSLKTLKMDDFNSMFTMSLKLLIS